MQKSTAAFVGGSINISRNVKLAAGRYIQSCSSQDASSIHSRACGGLSNVVHNRTRIAISHVCSRARNVRRAAGGGYSYCECKFCRAAYENDVTSTPPRRLIGRARNYASHLAKCKHFQDAQLSPAFPQVETSQQVEHDGSPALSFEVTPFATPKSVDSRTRSHSVSHTGVLPFSRESARRAGKSRARRSLVLDKGSDRSSKRRKSMPNMQQKPQKRVFTKSEIKCLENALIEAHAANKLSDRLMEDPAILRFLELVCPGISKILPSRHVLGKRILMEHAKRYQEIEVESLKSVVKKTGGWVNILSDGWMNIKKEHLVGCQLSLFGVILTYGLYPAGDEHHGIAIAMQLEQVLKQAQQEQWRVGAIITDNAGQCRRARQILAVRWPHIVFLSCFAHDVNNLVKSVLRSSFKDIAAQTATAVKIVNASSSKWLPRARKMMKNCYGRSLGLRTLCETRWDSMQGCFASLLRVQSALQMFYRRYKTYDDFPLELHVFGNILFWNNLKRAESVIAPLAYASYRLQRDENTVGDVVFSYRSIYKGFQQQLNDFDKLVDCVEARWAQCEQPLFMLGFALHPQYVAAARKLPNTVVSGIGALCKITVYYYRRLFGTEDIGQIRRDMLRWMKGTLTKVKASEYPDRPWEFWETVAAERHNRLLPKLAIRVLSIAVNTTTRNMKSEMSDPRKNLLISPIEKQIIQDNENIRSPSPQHVLEDVEEASDIEDPGDCVEGAPILSTWNEYLSEVFEDSEIDAGYLENALNSSNNGVGISNNSSKAYSDSENEFEEIAKPAKPAFPASNDRDFPQEDLVLKGFRGQKMTLIELFFCHSSTDEE
ncbi:unnamed protein product [Phytophthora fragariaefolia]|uniref:Unnamed protein product n=1 Tax=Phytophthora fragariaefolia TaxID=1490495 RepID=A0A9W6YIC8_9STRA|nr:unnamed protein product [Phytophthora fragariaefolia]